MATVSLENTRKDVVLKKSEVFKHVCLSHEKALAQTSVTVTKFSTKEKVTVYHTLFIHQTLPFAIFF